MHKTIKEWMKEIEEKPDEMFSPSYALKYALGDITLPRRKACSHERQRWLGGRWECSDCYKVMNA